jgi:hypothetical protein
MPTVLQLRRGTTAQNDAFTGAIGELSYDTQTKEVRTHDGSTAGGVTLATKQYVQDNEFSGAWDDVTGKPNFSAVALSGDYADLINALDLSALNGALVPDTGDTYGIGTASLPWHSLKLGGAGIYIDENTHISRSTDPGTDDRFLTIEDTTSIVSDFYVDVVGILRPTTLNTEDLQVQGNNPLNDGVLSLRAVGGQLQVVSSRNEFSINPGSPAGGNIGTEANPWSEVYSKQLHITELVSGNYRTIFNINAEDNVNEVTLAPTTGFALHLESDSEIILDGKVTCSSSFRVLESTDPTADIPTPSNGMMVYNSTTHKFQGYANGVWVDLH